MFAIWLVFTKTVKLWPHFYRYPSDLQFLPGQIAFGYFHGLIKLYTLLTLHKVHSAISGTRLDASLTNE